MVPEHTLIHRKPEANFEAGFCYSSHYRIYLI